jgi:hypothetical protein
MLTPQSSLKLEQAKLICHNYERLFERKLLENTHGDEKLVEQLWHAPFVLLSHGNETEPVFNFANLRATTLFEFPIDELLSLPSKMSAEPIEQQKREQLLKQVSEHGYIDNYSGVRVSSTGQRFRIDNAIIWDLLDERGQYRGQAAMFKHWVYLP